jgi:hypothetical protein
VGVSFGVSFFSSAGLEISLLLFARLFLSSAALGGAVLGGAAAVVAVASVIAVAV